jgi:hypothetical protein
MAQFLGLDRSRGYQPIPDKADLQFPQDNAVDLGSQVDWHSLPMVEGIDATLRSGLRHKLDVWSHFCHDRAVHRHVGDGAIGVRRGDGRTTRARVGMRSSP